MSWITFDPVASSAVALLCAWMAGKFLLMGHPRWRLVARGTLFVCLTLLLRAYDIVPFEVLVPLSGHPTRRVVGAAIEIAWWLVGAQLVRSAVRAVLRLGSPQRELTLVQEIAGAMVYLVAVIAILAYVLDLPVKGLLATSGAFAIIVGLALQSTLGDAFSGIVLNLERPYRVGDWVVVDNTVQGYVLETNWRTTHIQTLSNDLAIVPNSVIARSKLLNCSQPTPRHSSTVCVRLNRSLPFEETQELMQDVLLGCKTVVQAGGSSVRINDVSAEGINYELGFAVSDISSMDLATAEILRRVFYAVSIAGGGFASRLAVQGQGELCTSRTGGHRLLAAIPLFDTLTDTERNGLLDKMVRRMHAAGSVVARCGTVMQALVIVRRGVLVAWEQSGGETIESDRLTPGLYFGELGFLTGEPLTGNVTALTQAVTYEIGQDALAPILKARPAIADQLGETLELREQTRRSVLNRHHGPPVVNSTVVGRVADTIRQLFRSP